MALSRRDGAVELENSSLWRRFSYHGTEMIITKSGRRLFPTLRIRVRGLKKSVNYVLLVDVVPADQFRYRYEYSTWFVAGTDSTYKRSAPAPAATGYACASPTGRHDCMMVCQSQIDADDSGQRPAAQRRRYSHPDSPATGEHWMKQSVVSFHRLKLTNNTNDQHGNIIVNSLRKYRPRVFVVVADDVSTALRLVNSYSDGEDALPMVESHVSCHVFPETEFIAVTAYQNEAITQLKVDQNPFARGFRHDGRAQRDRSNMDSAHGNIRPSETIRLDDVRNLTFSYVGHAGATPRHMQERCLQSPSELYDYNTAH